MCFLITLHWFIGISQRFHSIKNQAHGFPNSEKVYSTLGGASAYKSGYMSRWIFSDFIRDYTTLPLNFELVSFNPWIDKDKLGTEFETLRESLSETDRAEPFKFVSIKAIMYDENYMCIRGEY